MCIHMIEPACVGVFGTIMQQLTRNAGAKQLVSAAVARSTGLLKASWATSSQGLLADDPAMQRRQIKPCVDDALRELLL